jgi:hypothetical protein
VLDLLRHQQEVPDVPEVPEYRKQANETLVKIGRRYDDGVARTIQHRHSLEIL